MYLYMHICPNGKKYVGITIQEPNQRWRDGKGYYKNKHFYNAILKYGVTKYHRKSFLKKLLNTEPKQLSLM